MLKRIIYFKTYRKINLATKKHDWNTALGLAKSIGDDELRKLFALNRMIQILDEPFNFEK